MEVIELKKTNPAKNRKQLQIIDMTPKEKAKDIIVTMMEYTPDHVIKSDIVAYELCKNHALIAVEPMIYFIELHNNEWHGWAEDLAFWQEVKQEIEKL